MKNIFEEAEELEYLIIEKRDMVENLIKYGLEILEKSYKNEVDYQNPDLCLDYISFPEYSSLISQNLKSIFYQLQSSLSAYSTELEKLTLLLKKLLQKIEKLSIISIKELSYLSILFNASIPGNRNESHIAFFQNIDMKLKVNPKLRAFVTYDMIELMKEYVIIKDKKEDLTLKVYLREEKERKRI